MKAAAMPVGMSWIWMLAFGHHEDRTPTHGYEATRERRPHLRRADRALFIWLYRRCPRILDAITIVRPETVVRWHRIGFVAF